jgi:hypothetical protein
VIPEIEIWRAANLMLKRHGDQAQAESPARADELAAAGDDQKCGHVPSIRDAVAEFANKNSARPGALSAARFST